MPDPSATDHPSPENDALRELEIGHVLFVDIVGYSKRLLNEQTALVKRLNSLVRGTDQFQKAEAAGKLITIPTGDGMALVFLTAPDAPVRCAIEINQADLNNPKIELRMGIHSGPIDRLADVNDQANAAGAGINIAQRVMDCGDGGHILLSRRLADDLGQHAKWQAQLHPLGEIEVKHGVRLGVVNLFSDTYGNPNIPERLRTSRRAEHKQSTRRKVMLAGVVALGLVLALAGSYVILVRRAEVAARGNIPPKSVAVLPFENMNLDQGNAFLAGGIQSEIITQLSKIGDLKVISRNSTTQYTGKQADLRQIAKDLGVAAILEGSVQKSENKIRVSVQLIQAATGAIPWSDHYDRELIDLLQVQSEIAQRVAAQLNTTLTAEETARLGEMLTKDPEAYALYLKGSEVYRSPAIAAAPMEEGIRDFEQAVARDPSFALAHARLGLMHSRLFLFYDPSPLHKERGRTEAEEALRLQPTLGEGHVALGFYFTRVAREYDAALREYELARKTVPNDVYIPYGIAWVQMKQGKWRASIANWERATALDPMFWGMYDNLGNAYASIGMMAAAEKTRRRAAELLGTALTPERFAEEQGADWFYFFNTGSFDKLNELIKKYATVDDPNGWIAGVHFDIRMAQRNYADARRAIEQSPVTIIEAFAGPRVTKSFYLGVVALAEGDTAKARPLFESELQFARNELREAPDNESRHAQLGLILAYLGQKDEAIAEGKRAVELMPVSKDAVDGPFFLINLAEIYARVGEPDQAMDLIEQSLKTPAGMNFRELQSWRWDPLREHPRFKKLISGPPPEIIYQ